ncbi:ABC transporter ATP-binding protein [Paeniglutamicibacter cryotolerans]|uniref:ABC-type multidrug transport system ATPase subunit n=1 Tax=Paeniglutamicibacter cryotolerans TaxID=670079 RepID=A0A839QHM7_9MICC|nr:ATP-binding cassette domain-containing protein [Paeniglutamicibacter cryotolerans]MBB2995267.1 ABC-type multidrug transport system ATPase subunit [Paeniglutamicibacter cryotolerans]
MDTHAAPLISATALVSGYGGLDICGPLDLQLRPGTALGIVGFNAAGKSTLLRTLVGYQEPVSGDVLILGAFTDDSSYLYRRAVSVVLDEDAFFPSLSVQEHLDLVARGHGLEHAGELVERELAFFDLEGARTAYPHALSSGQRRRLLLAAALIRPARLLVLDEPEQRLDPQMRAGLAARLRERVAAGATLLVVTHDPGFLAVVADHALVVADGEITARTVDAAAAAIRES